MFYVGAAEIVGQQRQGVGEMSGEGFFPAELMNFGGVGVPGRFIKKFDAGCFEFVHVINEAFAEQGYWFGFACEPVEELGGSH